MKDDTAIKVSHISKSFRLPHEKHDSLKDKAVHIFGPRNYTKFNALEDINFEIKKGEFFGIVGKNGSGKSTLLKILANIYQPTSGKVKISGSLAPFIELGVGFNPELTGRENVFLSGTILGLTKKKIESIYNDIVSFAEIEEFMDQKLKNYSSGMQVRLAFSIAVRAEADILLIDEVLAVGDSAFQAKCFDYFNKLKQERRTVVFVSHDMKSIESYCDKAVFIDDSELVAYGNAADIVNRYSDLVLERAFKKSTREISTKTRSSSKIARISSIEIFSNNKKPLIIRPNDKIRIEVKIKIMKKIDSPIVGLTIKREEDGLVVFAENTSLRQIDLGVLEGGSSKKVIFEMDNIFSNGKYNLTPAIADKRTEAFIDRLEDEEAFIVNGWENNYTPVQIRSKLRVL